MNTESPSQPIPCPTVLPKFAHCSLNDMQSMYDWGQVSEQEMTEYLRSWNAGPHYTRAVFCDGRIRNFDPEHRSYRHLWEKYGVKP